MKRCCLLLCGLISLTAASTTQAGWSVGVRIGGPGHYHYHGPRFYGYYGPRYYYPTPVVVAPPPVVYAPAPVVVAAPAAAPAAAVVTNSPQQTTEPPAVDAPPPPPAPTLPAPTPIARGAANNASNDLASLNDPSPQARAEAIIALGRSRDRQAVSPITRALREDKSAAVREAAARALGLIGLPASLTALQNAAQGDADRDVRRSAAFAADVIRANMQR